MKSLFIGWAFLISFNLFAQPKIVPTEGKELHFTCVLNFTPFFIELSPSHLTGKLFYNNRYDDQGRGYSREFITNIKLSSQKETSVHKLMNFISTRRSSEFRALSLQVPKYINLYLGMPDQPARIDLDDDSHLPGSCHVQFPAMAPQW